MRLRLTALAAGTALLLAGCSPAADPASAPSPAAPSASAAQPSSASSASEAAPSSAAAEPAVEKIANSGQKWADEKIGLWVKNSGIKSVKGFLPPYNAIDSWESPAPGEILIHLDNTYSFTAPTDPMEMVKTVKDDLRLMGRIMIESVGNASPELESITFETANGKESGTWSRARTGADPADREAWADEKYQQWLEGMNDTYESMCGTLTSIEVYRKCIPSDPHAYIGKVESPAPGDLVVTLDDGPWTGGTYDEGANGAASFVTSNMMLKINEKAARGEKVESLTVKTADGSQEHTEYRG